METNTQKSDCVVSFTLPNKLTLHEASELRNALLEAGSKNAGVALDCCNVIDIKTPLAQVLISGHHFFLKKNLSFRLLNVEGPVKFLFDELGIASELSKMES